MLIPIHPYRVEKELVGDIDKLNKKAKKERRKLYEPERRSPFAIDINNQATTVIPSRGSIFAPAQQFIAIAPSGPTIETVPGTPLKRRVSEGRAPSIKSIFPSGEQTPAKPRKVEISLDIPAATEKLDDINSEITILNSKIMSAPPLSKERAELVEERDKLYTQAKEVDAKIRAAKEIKSPSPIKPRDQQLIKDLPRIQKEYDETADKLSKIDQEINAEEDASKKSELQNNKVTMERYLKVLAKRLKKARRISEERPELKEELGARLKKRDIEIIGNLSKENDELKKQLTTLDKEIKALKEKEPESEKELDYKIEKVNELSDLVRGMERKMKENESVIRDLTEEKERLEFETKEVEKRNTIITGEINRLFTPEHRDQYHYYNLHTGEILLLGKNLGGISDKLGVTGLRRHTISTRGMKADEIRAWGPKDRDDFIIFKPEKVGESNAELKEWIEKSLISRKKIQK